MPDRSLRLLTLPPQSPQGGERGAVLLRERPASPPDAPSGDGTPPEDDNPFAPPPENAPDRPWQPRRPAGGAPEGGGSPWGSQWSDRQPGRSPGGFGERPGRGPENGNGNGGPGPENGGKRWDPTDPAQRRARYALLSGMWAFFFVLFGWPYVALLLGALALNWGISALRAKPRSPSPDSPRPESGPRPQKTAAVSGVVTASLALALVAASFTAQLVYQDYYTCTNDALTNEAKQSCNDLLPKELRKILGTDS
ncbi:hypothetical protein QFZ56_004768 [Streptomyces achromogenes]|uniref:Integral membrane protein n=1 Tax=Streptomyces achromogenes TaxID=67255 RepID=A0ABU0Q564_STRAH|nr:hypothetical protein [Streptomyces achromogenes]MDQ0685805.1 hypothetical protein [Streptomyces achromogenes]